MCVDCVKEQFPERENICLETGSYLMNFTGCAACKRKEPIKIVNRVEEENEDGEEVVTYQHLCASCDHVIANHQYRFTVEDEFQLYEMYCILCGRGDDTRSIMPHDPREQPMFF